MLSQLRLGETLVRSSSRLSIRCLTTSAAWRMPRRARLQETGEEEEKTSTEHEKWVDFINRSRTGSLSEELKSFTNFGSVRLDQDNTARIEGIEGYRGEQFGKTFEKTAEKTEKVEINNWLGLIVEEDEGHIKYTAFNQSNNTMELENAQSILVENRLKSTDPSKRVENSTIPVNFHQSEPPSQSRAADLNYVDNLYFKESYEQFDSVTANRARDVSVDPSVMMTREQTAETDLNYIDSMYFPPVSPDTSDGVTELKPDRSESEKKFGRSSEDLNSIDDQYFKISPEPVESHFAVDQRTLDTTVTGDLKGIDALSILSNEEKVSKKKKKKQKDKARLSTEGTALEYVRELRKENQNLPGKVDPSAMIGKSLQDRFLAAASNLQSRPVTSRAGLEEEEEEGETVQTVNKVKKFKPPDLEKYTRFEIRDLLFSKILYDNHDIVAIWKPYGLPMFTTESNNKTIKRKKSSYSMEYFKADLATKLGAETLHEVHRLDSTTTGVLLYAKTKEVELMLRKLFKERRIQKTYLAICNGTPVAESGVIDIPVGEAKIQSRMRMTLRPDYSSSKIITNKKIVGKTAESAITEYKVLATSGNASFVQTEMVTGRKHQIRLHLGLGLGTPILGDSKYSYSDKLGKPQRVMGDIVNSLKISQSKARNLPIFLHSRRVVIPEILPNGKDLMT